MPPVPLPPPRYLRFASLSALLATVALLGLPSLLWLLTGATGGFTSDTLNTFALAAALFWLVLQLGFLAYRMLFRRFKVYQAECLEESGKLFENVTDELRAPLWAAPVFAPSPERLNLFIERRRVAQFTFLVRCVRLVFCLLSLYALVCLAERVLSVAMLATPAGALLSQ